jgi:hypothetical protein
LKESGSHVQEVAVVAGNPASAGIIFTPNKLGWETGKLVVKIKSEKGGPGFKVTLGLFGYGGLPVFNVSRDGAAVGEKIDIGLIMPGTEVNVLDVTNAGDAAGFVKVQVLI